jgi:Domain of unknown function (DUF4055)
MSVATKHADYVHYEQTWVALRDAYAGSGAVKLPRDASRPTSGVKAAGTKYLPRPSGMRREEQYILYRDRAVWLGATERAVQGLTGAVFRRPPQVEAPTRLTPQLEDVTQTGVPLRTFAEQAVRETLLMGRFGVLVDYPAPERLPDGTEIPPPPDARPYWVAYTAEEIVNWRTMQRQGDTLLSLVVLAETVSEPEGVWPHEDFFRTADRRQYRVLRLNEDGWYEQSVWTTQARRGRQAAATGTLEQRWLPLRQGEPLDFIPFCFMAPFSLEPHVEKSLMEALVEVNYQYYRHSADYEHALHMTALPTAYITSTGMEAGTEYTIGSSVAWVIADSTATVGMLEFHGQGLQSHEHAMESDIKNMGTMGARLLESAPAIAETATANRNRLDGADSPMQSLITTVSHGLMQALQVHSWWAAATDNVDDTAITLSLNRDIVANTMEPLLLTALVNALLNGTISYETFYYNLARGEVARPMIPVEEEQALLELHQLTQPLAPAPGSPPTGRNGTRVGA